jgi:hypothetical protein
MAALLTQAVAVAVYHTTQVCQITKLLAVQAVQE